MGARTGSTRRGAWTPTSSISRRLARWSCIIRVLTRGITSNGGQWNERASSSSLSIIPGRKGAGRVDLVRKGNTVEVSTKGVRRLTLLVSPDEFDFAAPLKVIANGRV